MTFKQLRKEIKKSIGKSPRYPKATIKKWIESAKESVLNYRPRREWREGQGR